MNPDSNTVVLVGYLAGDQNRHKRVYLDSLDASLHERGYRLMLVDQGGHPVEGNVMTRRFDPSSAASRSVKQELYDDLSRDRVVQNAVALEAGFLSLPENDAAERLFSPAAAIIASFIEERPCLALIWHQFNGISMLVTRFCRSHGIPFLYVHLGPVPGVIVFEPDGQMAESWIVRENRRFMRLPLSQDDLNRSAAYLEWVREHFLDRKRQPEPGTLEYTLRGRANTDRPVIFYAGQNDYRTGMTPRCLPDAKWHSPLYGNTVEALQHLAGIAAKQKWTVLFKPHPNLKDAGLAPSLPHAETVVAAPGANLFECILHSDVTVTILSTSAYQALIHRRPVVLLGRMPLTGKRCAYEVPAKCLAAHTIRRALRNGFTAEQEQFWQRHLAQVLKYYVFAFDEGMEAIIGRDARQASGYLVSILQGKPVLR